MSILLTILHVIFSVVLILVVLLQTGKRADLAGAFGGGGSQTAFGTRGAATFLSKLTTAAAIVFMLTSLGLSIVSSRSTGPGGTVLPDEETAPPAQTSSLPAPPEQEQPAAGGEETAPASSPTDAPGSSPENAPASSPDDGGAADSSPTE